MGGVLIAFSLQSRSSCIGFRRLFSTACDDTKKHVPAIGREPWKEGKQSSQ